MSLQKNCVRRRHRCFPWIKLLVITGASGALAQEYSIPQNYLSENDLLGDIPMVSSASHFPQERGDAPVAVSIIDQQMIRASGALNVPDLFRLMPGFQTYIVDGGRPTVNYRTIPDEYPHRMEVKIDGRSVYEPLISAVLWESLGIELEDIDYIEVVRGANAPADGSNSFNGSINIITKSPQATTGSSVRLLGGDSNTRHLSGTHSNTLEEFSYRLAAEYKYSEGFPAGDEPATHGDNNDIYNLDFYGSWTPTLYDTINIHAGVNDSTLATSTLLDSSAGYQPVPWKILSHYQYLDWRRQIDSHNQLQLLAYHNHMTIDVEYDIGLASDVYGVNPSLVIPGLEDFTLTYEIDSRSDRYDAELRHSLRFGTASQFSWGGAIRYDRIDNPDFFNQRSAFGVQSGRVFGNLQYSVNEFWLFNLGAISEHRESYGSTQSYRTSLNIKPLPNQSFRLSYNNARRAPTILEEQMYYAIYEQGFLIDVVDVAGENLDEEELESIELGYLGSFFNQTLTIDISLFDEENRGLLTGRKGENMPGDVDGRVRIRDNVTYIEDRGIELQATFQPSHQWLITGQYTYVDLDAVKVVTKNPTVTRPDDETSPRHMGSLLVSYTLLNGYELSGVYYRQSEVDWSGGSVVDSYDRLDLRLGKRFNLGGASQLDINLIAQNAFGDDYPEFHDFNKFEPRYFVKANFNF